MLLKQFINIICFIIISLIAMPTIVLASSCTDAISTRQALKTTELREMMRTVSWIASKVSKDINTARNYNYQYLSVYRRDATAKSHREELIRSNNDVTDVSFAFYKKNNELVFSAKWTNANSLFGEKSKIFKLATNDKGEFVSMNGVKDPRAAKYFLSALTNSGLIYVPFNEIYHNKDGSISRIYVFSGKNGEGKWGYLSKQVDIVNYILSKISDGDVLREIDKP